MATKIENVYTSCSCNRTPKCLDWGHSNRIAYATCNGIAVYSPNRFAVVEQILTGHKDRVNCVRWIKGCDEALVSGSCDHSCIVWTRQDQQLGLCSVLSGHQGSVTSVDAVKVSGSRTVIVTTSADSTIKVWQSRDQGLDPGSFECTQTISFGSGFALDVALTVLPNTQALLLACAGDDHKVHIYVQQHGQFECCEKLVGHEDWVRGLQFTTHGNSLFLASCSQDCYIRIWRFAPRGEGTASQDSQDPQDVTLKDSQDLEDITLKDSQDLEDIKLKDSQDLKDIKLKENTIQVTENDTCHVFAVTLESVLQGHDNWVYSVAWQPSGDSGGNQAGENGNHASRDGNQELCLLSASMDKTMIIWKPDSQSGLWLEHTRVGEVGGNSLGFYGGVFSPDGMSVMSHGYQGAMERYKLNKETLAWKPQPTFGGHFDCVQDIAWQPQTGHFLLSLGSDQTTRCHGYWKAPDNRQVGWYEVARPQIHGYDMTAIAMIDRYRFASGADEKVVRVFEASRNFIENLSRISDLQLDKDVLVRSEGASVPALGLSNKAVDSYQGNSGSQDNTDEAELYFTPVCTDCPPSEVDLLQNTLWPEIHKLYGHGYEIFTLACNPQGTLLASACKSARCEDAAILVWCCDTWRHLHTLQSHSLTVTQLAWSHDGKHLLSVSRDRTWGLYQHTGTEMKRIAHTDKSTCIHSRIIWSCAWSHDDVYFATVSRDKKALLWMRVSDDPVKYEVTSCLTLTESVTAVDWAPTYIKDSYVVAFGFESGLISVYRWLPSNQEPWKQLLTLSKSESHHLTVKRLKFRPVQADNTSDLYLASCGADHCVRIYRIHTQQLL